MKIIKDCILDCTRSNNFKTYIAKQNDTNSRFIRATLTDNGNDMYVDDDNVVVIGIKRSDNEIKTFKGYIEQGKVLVPIPNWALENTGYVECDIAILNSSLQEKLSSTKFALTVEENFTNGDDISADENYDFLLQLITDVDTAVKSCNTAADKANDIYNTVEEKLNSGELKGDKGDKGDKGEKGDPYELTISDIWKIVNNIPYASSQSAGKIKTPIGCGIQTDDKDGSAKVLYKVPDLTSTTDDIKVDKQTGDFIGNGYCKLTFNSDKYALKAELPTKTSDLENDSNFVSDENYIHTDNNFTDEEKAKLENDVATKDYVEQEIATFDFIKIVEELPETGLPNRTYFIPKAEQQTNDLYDEYMWVNNAWEFVGTRQIEVDLTNYALKSELPQKINNLAIQVQYGLPPLGIYSGLSIYNNRLVVKEASKTNIKGRYNRNGNDGAPIFPSEIDYAVKVAMCDGVGAEWTEAEKQGAMERIGAQPKFEVGEGLSLSDGVLSLDLPSATAETLYGGDTQ